MNAELGVAVLQAILRVGGGMNVNVDGIAGSQTQLAVNRASPNLLEQANNASLAIGGKSIKDMFPNPIGNGSFGDVVVPAVVAAARLAGLLPLAVVAQVAFESGWGQSELSAKYYNYAGLKYNSVAAFPGMKPGSTQAQTIEFIEGRKVSVSQGFATFASAAHFAEVYTWYLLASGSSYRYKGLENARSTEEYFMLLKRGGYATDPLYVEKLNAVTKTVQRRFSNLA